MNEVTTTPYNVSNITYIYMENSRIMDLAMTINKYYLWVILAFGFPGNLATIVTIVRMRHLGSFTLYVVLLAVMDTLSLAIKIMFYQILGSGAALGTPGCKFLKFMGNYSSTFANWVLVLMAIERLLAVRYPLRVQKFLTCKRSVMIIISVGLGIGAAYAPIIPIVYYNEKADNCESLQNSHMPHLMTWVNTSLYAFIPFIILALSNILIGKAIRNSFRIRRALQCISSDSFRPRCCDVSIQRQILLMLFTSTFVFVVLLFPICAFVVTDHYWEVKPYTEEYDIKYLCQQIAFVLCDSTHAVNFYLYFLSARKFRKAFTQMPTCPKGSQGRPASL
ncbi:rhodopsin-like [Aplysia californica]|uniref:Rhodopsin-like n=1 Tax=Aplysia californica TaxID=6500 RepID=A0ABM1VQD8_APLCA|nr:rhodopsin-like [Aplysia californica]